MPAIGVIPAIIGAAGSIGAAALGAHAANQASQQQQQAGQKSIAALSPLYNTATSNITPFTQLGQASLGNLYALTGQRAPASTGPSMPQGPQGYATGPFQSGGSGMSLMQAPDGSTQQVPNNQVQRFLALGARVVQPGGQQQPIGGNPSIGTMNSIGGGQ